MEDDGWNQDGWDSDYLDHHLEADPEDQALVPSDPPVTKPKPADAGQDAGELKEEEEEHDDNEEQAKEEQEGDQEEEAEEEEDAKEEEAKEEEHDEEQDEEEEAQEEAKAEAQQEEQDPEGNAQEEAEDSEEEAREKEQQQQQQQQEEEEEQEEEQEEQEEAQEETKEEQEEVKGEVQEEAEEQQEGEEEALEENETEGQHEQEKQEEQILKENDNDIDKGVKEQTETKDQEEEEEQIQDLPSVSGAKAQEPEEGTEAEAMEGQEALHEEQGLQEEEEKEEEEEEEEEEGSEKIAVREDVPEEEPEQEEQEETEAKEQKIAPPNAPVPTPEAATEAAPRVAAVEREGMSAALGPGPSFGEGKGKGKGRGKGKGGTPPGASPRGAGTANMGMMLQQHSELQMTYRKEQSRNKELEAQVSSLEASLKTTMAKCSDLERSYTNLNGLYSRLQANHSELEAKTAAASQTPGGSGADLAASDTSEVVNAEALVPPERSRASSIASRSSVDPLIRPPSPFQEKMDVFLDSQPLAPESPQAVNCPSRSAFGRSFPSIAPALFLSFCAPVHTLEEAPLALAHVVGSVALLLVFAVPSYAMAHDDGNDMEVACVWDWASRGSFVSVMLLLLSLFAWNGRLAVYEAVLLLLMSVVWYACVQNSTSLKTWAEQTLAASSPHGRPNLQVLTPLLLAGVQNVGTAAVEYARGMPETIRTTAGQLGAYRRGARGGGGPRRGGAGSDVEEPHDMDGGNITRISSDICEKPRRPSSLGGLLMTPVHLAIHYTIPSPSRYSPGFGLLAASVWVLVTSWLLSYSALVACTHLSLPIAVVGLLLTSTQLNLPDCRLRERAARSGSAQAEAAIAAALHSCGLSLAFALPAGLVARAVLLNRSGISTRPVFPVLTLVLAVIAALITAAPLLNKGRLPRRRARQLMQTYPGLVGLAATLCWAQAE